MAFAERVQIDDVDPAVAIAAERAVAALLEAFCDKYRIEPFFQRPRHLLRVDVVITERRGVVIRLETVNWITNDGNVGDQLLAALVEKWGPAKLRGDTSTWLVPGRRMTARKPASGNFEIVIDRR